MIEQCVAMRLDIFCTGVILGGVTVFVAQWAIKFLELWIGNNQKKLDLELGKALEKIRSRLPQQDLYADESKRQALKAIWYEGVAIENIKTGDLVLYNAANGHTKIRSS